VPTVSSAATPVETTQLNEPLQLRSRDNAVEELGENVEVLQQVLYWCMEELDDRG
jgi:hypothetical protein